MTGDVAANGLQFHYTRAGGDGPSLVMAHGHSDSGLCWGRMARVLEKDHDLIMYDARRHGLSEDGPDDAPPEAQANDAAGLIEALGLVKPGMIGHSMGAAAAAMTGAMFPNLLSYIILVDPPWFDAESAQRRARARRTQPTEGLPTTREGWLERCRQEHPTWHEEEVQPWADAKMLYHTRDWNIMRGERPSWQDLASKIVCPTLLITGDPELGAIVTPSLAEEALGLLVDGHHANIPGAGHSIHREGFEETVAAILGFLAKI